MYSTSSVFHVSRHISISQALRIKVREASRDTKNTRRFGLICLLGTAVRLRIAAIIHSQTEAQPYPFFTKHVFVFLIVVTVALYKNKQDRKCKNNVTLSRVRVTIVDVGKQ